MALYILAYPQISSADFAWIQTIRASYDPRFELVKPHFTLVFGVSDVAPQTLVDHVKTAVPHHLPIQFALRCATAVKDSFSPYTHTFLVPDEGHSALVRLHDRLYSGPLADALRLDVPFIPHITIAGFPDGYESKKLADELNREPFCIIGQIQQLDVVSLDQGQLHSVAAIS